MIPMGSTWSRLSRHVKRNLHVRISLIRDHDRCSPNRRHDPWAQPVLAKPEIDQPLCDGDISPGNGVLDLGAQLWQLLASEAIDFDCTDRHCDTSQTGMLGRLRRRSWASWCP